MSNPKKIEELEEATELSGDDLLLTSVQQDSDTFVSKTINLRQVAQFAYPEFAIGPNTQYEPLINWSESTNPNSFPEGWKWNREFVEQDSNPWYCDPILIEHDGILRLRIDTVAYHDEGDERTKKHSMIPVLFQYGTPIRTLSNPPINDDFTWTTLVGEDSDNPGNSNTIFIPVLNGAYVHIGRPNTLQFTDYKEITLGLFYNP